MRTKEDPQASKTNILKIGLLFILLTLPYCYSAQSQYAATSSGALSKLSPAQMQGSPGSETRRVIVLLAELSDASNSTSVATINSTVFNKMAAYYDEVSYKELTVVGNITDWIYLNNVTAQYGKDTGSGTSGIDDVDGDGVPDAWWLIRDMVKRTDDTINYARYDTVMVVHSGEDQAQHPTTYNDIWSSDYSGLEIPTNDGVTITSGIIVSEQDPMGIFAHEYGHALGLPDLYNVNGGPEFVGDWDLMAEGAWLGSPQGTSPSHLTSWCKTQLVWIGNDSLLVGRSVTGVIDRLEIMGNNFTAIKIPVTTDTYYLVEVRQKILYDSYLPATGVLVLYVDETLTSGNGIVKVKYSQSLPSATYTAAPSNNKYIDGNRNVNITVLTAYSSSYRVIIGLIIPDTTPPSIDVVSPVPWTLPATVAGQVRAVITDVGSASSSVRNATVVYSSDGGQTWNRIMMDVGIHDTYSVVIPPQNASRVEYYVEAYDYAGNLAIANNSGHYYVYGSAEQGLIILAIAIIIVSLACVTVAVVHGRKRSLKAEL